MQVMIKKKYLLLCYIFVSIFVNFILMFLRYPQWKFPNIHKSSASYLNSAITIIYGQSGFIYSTHILSLWDYFKANTKHHYHFIYKYFTMHF